MKKRSIVPYGPQHPVLPEPIHLDLVIEDEKIVEAIPSIGFIHRGLESLTQKRDFNQMVYVAERVCGICSFGHGFGYCEAVEDIMDVEVPDRAQYLRTIWFELSRMHSHFLWLGLLADGFGFENLFYQCWRIREKILDVLELTTGGRVIFSVNKIGGVMKDITPEMAGAVLDMIHSVKKELDRIVPTFMEDYSVVSRLKGVGVLTKQQAHDLGCAGPFARASGIKTDMRKLGYAAYGDLDFDIITSDDGDSYARCYVRINEIYQSINIIRQAVEKLPEGELAAAVKGNPKGESFVRIEQPRGEAIYYVSGNGSPHLDRMRVRTPTFANLAGLCETLKGADYADVGLLILTIDPCISCTER